MIQALAPGKRRGCWWVWLVTACLLAASPTARAQDTGKTKAADATKKAGAPAKGEATKGDAAKGEEAPDEPPLAAPPRSTPAEVYKDERAEKALEVFKAVPGLRDTTPQIISSVKAMAAGAASPDREQIQRFVDGMAYRLIDRANINALINPPEKANPNSPAMRAIKDAADNLLDALNTAKLAKNQAFLTPYRAALLQTMPKLLDNNLVSRVQAMTVLSQTGDPNAVPTFLAQLKSADQTIWVKLSALRGLTGVVEGGTTVDAALGATRAIEAGKVVADFLAAEKGLPWPVEMRAMEALGALRQAAVVAAQGKADMAHAAMDALADDEASAEVRATAAWALGMFRVNPSAAKYNFGLVAFLIGRLSADLGEKVLAQSVENPVLAQRYASQLVGPIYQAFNGTPDARESGLLNVPASHPAAAASRAFVKQVADLSAGVAKASVELVRTTPGQRDRRKQDLTDRVAALKEFLDKNPPKDFHLVPSGPEFKPGAAPVADQADAAPAAGLAGGR